MTCNTWSNRTVLQQFKEQVSLDGLERPGINLQQPFNTTVRAILGRVTMLVNLPLFIYRRRNS